MGVDREEQCFVMVKDRNMGQVKSDLIHALLRVPGGFLVVLGWSWESFCGVLWGFVRFWVDFCGVLGGFL